MGIVMVLDEKAMKRLLKKGVVYTFRMNRRTGIENWFGSGCIFKNGNLLHNTPNKINVIVEEIGEINPQKDLVWYLKDSGFDTLEEWQKAIKKHYDVFSGLNEKSNSLPKKGWLYKIIYFKDDEKNENKM